MSWFKRYRKLQPVSATEMHDQYRHMPHELDPKTSHYSVSPTGQYLHVWPPFDGNRFDIFIKARE